MKITQIKIFNDEESSNKWLALQGDKIVVLGCSIAKVGTYMWLTITYKEEVSEEDYNIIKSKYEEKKTNNQKHWWNK